MNYKDMEKVLEWVDDITLRLESMGWREDKSVKAPEEIYLLK